MMSASFLQFTCGQIYNLILFYFIQAPLLNLCRCVLLSRFFSIFICWDEDFWAFRIRIWVHPLARAFLVTKRCWLPPKINEIPGCSNIQNIKKWKLIEYAPSPPGKSQYFLFCIFCLIKFKSMHIDWRVSFTLAAPKISLAWLYFSAL